MSIAKQKSPCVRNCCLDEEDVCLGCGRTLDEILSWTRYSDSEIEQVLDRSRSRMARRLSKQSARNKAN